MKLGWFTGARGVDHLSNFEKKKTKKKKKKKKD